MSETNTIPEARFSVQLKGALAAHVNRRMETALHESHDEYIRDLIRRDMWDADNYDLREGMIEGYADVSAGRFTEDLSHEEIFAEALEALRSEGCEPAQG